MENEIITIDGFVIGEIYKNTSLCDMTGETWKDIPGYEGKYMVSNLGRVKSLNYRNTHKPAIMVQDDNAKNNYLRIRLGFNKSKVLVHRLVASAFIENKENLPCVNHKNNNRRDNRVENLEWCTYRDNNIYGNRIELMLKNRKGPNEIKSVYCVELNLHFASISEAARNTNVSNANICSCCRGKLKTAGGYHWQYYVK